MQRHHEVQPRRAGRLARRDARAIAVLLSSIVLVGLGATLSGCDPCDPDLCSDNDCRDCAFIGERLSTSMAESCSECQGAPCEEGSDSTDDPCWNYPCVDGQYVVQLCSCDDDCDGLAPFCGQYASTHDVCQMSDPV
jgi:hypothetical protein